MSRLQHLDRAAVAAMERLQAAAQSYENGVATNDDELARAAQAAWVAYRRAGELVRADMKAAAAKLGSRAYRYRRSLELCPARFLPARWALGGVVGEGQTRLRSWLDAHRESKATERSTRRAGPRWRAQVDGLVQAWIAGEPPAPRPAWDEAPGKESI